MVEAAGAIETTEVVEAPAASTLAEVTADPVAAAAAVNNMPQEEVQAQLDAGEIRIAPSGHIAIIDPALTTAPQPAAEIAGETAAIPGNPTAGSRPGAPVTIYLDFDGAIVTGTGWNEAPGATSYDLAGAPGIDPQEVWERVAEDYAPFNVNVTTTEPDDDALYKTSADDATYGSHLVVTDSMPDFGEGSGGIAILSSMGAEYLSPAFVFTEGVGGGDSADATAESVSVAASHEVGHNLGLSHDALALRRQI